MGPIALVFRAEARELVRNRWVLAYGIGMAAIAEALFLFGGNGPQVLLSLLNATLLLVPLIALVFGTVHVYASREFIELLLTQPLSRQAVFLGLYLGLAMPLAVVSVFALGVPLLAHGTFTAAPAASIALIGVGAVLIAVFTAVAMVFSLSTDDRLSGMGMALGAWFFCTIGFDGGVLALVAVLGEWPLEKPLLALMFLNPVDVARVLVLAMLDSAALLGYTGALFRRLFDGSLATVIGVSALLLWTAGPVLLARRRFLRRDF